MSVTDPAKWSCPSCHRTVTVFASTAPDQHAAIVAIQKRHARAHAEAAAVLARLGLPNPHPARQPRRKAS